MYIAWNGEFKPGGFFPWKNFKVLTARDQQPNKGPTRATYQRYVLSLIFTSRVITQFEIRLHHYTACLYSTEHRKLKPCGFFSLKNFKVRTARDRQPYKGPTKAIQDIISLIITFRVMTQFDIRLHQYTACVYSMERRIQTMRIFFLGEFQSANSARSSALQRVYKIHQRCNLSHYYFLSYNPVRCSFAPIYSVCI